MADMNMDTSSSSSTGGEPAGGGIKRGAAEGWKKGEFQLLFIYMGRGDCCVVTCPDGKHIIIDCGSNQSDHDVDEMSVVDLIRSNEVLNLHDSATEQVEALILTHPDEDHYSQIWKVLAKTHYETLHTGGMEPLAKKPKIEGNRKISHRPIKIKKVYFSDTQSYNIIKYDTPLYSYQCVKDNINIGFAIKSEVAPEELYRVRLNKKEKQYDKWTRPYDESTQAVGNIAGDEFTILKAADDAWSVSIIAGNVLKELDDKSDVKNSNAGSLVVLIKIGKEKALICGDATTSTENYLLEKYKNKDDIKNLDLIQVPHHGSALTSSSEAFVNMTCPKRAIISVKKIEIGNRHPSKVVLDRYKRHAMDSEPHPIHYWEENQTKYQDEKKGWKKSSDENTYTYMVIGTGQTKSWLKQYRKDGEDQDVDGTYQGYVVLYAAGNSDGASRGIMLYQEVTTKEIRETGVNKDQWIYLTGKPEKS